ncbi:unnamed protein product [Allacma fusca]|uniref:Headcase protein n=1 Tax=Allacma fusca TaxID=39272 RepID=A0A8J2MGR9_9HEXA|nr:unnamed protein product [Allacma fusca]
MPPSKKNQPNGALHGQMEGAVGHPQARPTRCCVPTECLNPGKLIYLEDIGTSDVEVVKVACNNDHCDQGQYMHRECFDTWEQTVLTYLRSCGRARSWSEKQRLQNLWTKRGYDLAFKACSCKCGKGHLRKDLDWLPPVRHAGAVAIAAAVALEDNNVAQANVANGRNGAAVAAAVPIPGNGVGHPKKKKNKTKERPTLAISAPVPHPNNNHKLATPIDRPHIGSVGSQGSWDCGLGASLTSSVCSRPRVNSLSSTGSAASSSGVSGSPPSPGAQFGSPVNSYGMNLYRFRKNSKGLTELGTERTRHNSGGIFSRRMDFSSFNALPRHKLNSYHIKMEDETHGNDDTRNFVLATLIATKTNRISCVLCHTNLIIFDRYPLIDGTFFLTPRQHTKACVETMMPDGRVQYLSAVCMSCLEGWSVNLYCRCCRSKWDGSSLVLGTCYSYDIFAATPCCRERLACISCKSDVIEQRPNFFSEYSQSARCPKCGLVDFHLAKALPSIFDKRGARFRTFIFFAVFPPPLLTDYIIERDENMYFSYFCYDVLPVVV